MTITLNKHKQTFSSIEKLYSLFDEIYSKEKNRNNRKILKKLYSYLKEHDVKALHNYLIVKTTLAKKLAYDFSSIPADTFDNILSELNNEKYFQFDRKLDSISAEISILTTLQNKGYILDKRSNKNSAFDWEMLKKNKKYFVEVKQKESDDFFQQRVYSFLNGFSLLDQYSFLREHQWIFKFLTNKKDHSAEKEIWDSLIKFVKQKDYCYEDKNILLFSRECIKKIEFVKKCPKCHEYMQNIYQDKLIKTNDNEKMFRVVYPLFEKLKNKKDKFFYEKVISSIVLHNNFHDQLNESFPDYIEKKAKEFNVKPFLLMIYHTIGETESYYFE